MASRNQKIVESPVTKWYDWKTVYDDNENPVGGTVVSYNKETGENEKSDLPFSFALINDSFVTFKGYSESSQSGVWSNEGSKPEHVITLKSKDDNNLLSFPLGKYKENKAKVESLGAKYTKVLYIAVKNEEGWELCALKLSGAGLTGGVDMDNIDHSEKNHGYFNFTKNSGKGKLFSNMITIKDSAVKKKGKTKFFVPVFEVGQAVNDQENVELMELNNTLDEYHKYYFSNNKEEVKETVVTEEKEPWDN